MIPRCRSEPKRLAHEVALAIAIFSSANGRNCLPTQAARRDVRPGRKARVNTGARGSNRRKTRKGSLETQSGPSNFRHATRLRKIRGRAVRRRESREEVGASRSVAFCPSGLTAPPASSPTRPRRAPVPVSAPAPGSGADGGRKAGRRSSAACHREGPAPAPGSLARTGISQGSDRRL